MTARRIRRALALITCVSIVCLHAAPASAYLKFGYEVNGKAFTLKWTTTPVRYFVTDAGVPGVTSSQFQAAVATAFRTWESVPTASITYQFAGFTRSLPGEDDGRTTLGFLNGPELDRVLASTGYLVDGQTGELIESDIFFNSAFQWSVAASGERGKFDLESIALHEIGHLNGLGHSAIGETEMATGGLRRRWDDLGSDHHPRSALHQRRGSAGHFQRLQSARLRVPLGRE